MIALLVFLAIAAVLIATGINLYNSLVRARNQVKNAWSQIDVQLKRRHDLIPNLIETAKGYVTHERGTLESVTNARARAMGAGSVAEKSRAETALSAEMGNFFVVVENYPDLKANQNFLALQEELSSTENKIAFARQAYNDQALFLNNRIETFPSNLIAGAYSFRKEEYFELEDKQDREVPKVQF
ncbi:MAG: LemA family protein [bacterium]